MRPAHAEHAMVASVHPDASKAGVDIMQAGGNAVDAAVAVGFALAVVHPGAGNIGGGGFMLVRMADGTEHFLDYREKAPAKATANMYLDAQGNVIPGASTIGYKSMAVPGSVAGLAYAQKHWGKLPLAKVMAPAIRLAREGWVLSYEDAEDFKDEELAKFPESRRIFQRDGNFYKQGEVFKQPELAATLERIAQNPDEFYRGQMAKQIAAAMQKGGGLITVEDLASYEVKERQPIHGTYKGFEIISAPPPSSGGIALVVTLNILEGYDLGKSGNRSAQSIHLISEAFSRAFYDRAEFLGDPDFAKIPVAQLIDKKYGTAWRESLNPENLRRMRKSFPTITTGTFTLANRLTRSLLAALNSVLRLCSSSFRVVSSSLLDCNSSLAVSSSSLVLCNSSLAESTSSLADLYSSAVVSRSSMSDCSCSRN
jgi:gamma-glutamyltranspeptidase/glutathione hydrolase